MPATHSKLAEAPEAERAQQQAHIQMCLWHILHNVTCLCIPIQAGPKIVTEAFAGDFSKAASFLGLCSAGTALFEFLFNPSVGCWADDHGRRKPLMVGPLIGAAASAIYMLNPASLAMTMFVRVVGNGTNAISGSTTTVAALADICRGDQALSTRSLAQFAAYAGAGVMLGPAVGGFVLSRTVWARPGRAFTRP